MKVVTKKWSIAEEEKKKKKKKNTAYRGIRTRSARIKI